VGVVPCTHPTRRSVAFDELTKAGISAQQAVAHFEGQCSTPLHWTVGAETQDSELSVQIELDQQSAVEVTYPASDACANKLTIEGDIVLSTADGRLDLHARGVFEYTRPSRATLDPIESPATLSLPVEALQGVGDDAYAVRISGACAGEIYQRDRESAVVGAWSRSGCPPRERAVDEVSRPEIGAYLKQLAKAWHQARLAAVWDSGDRTELDLDVAVSAAPFCMNPYGVVSVPVEVRYGTRDGLLPVHDAPGQARFNLFGDALNVRLELTQQTDCSALSPPLPGYCEDLSSAELRLQVIYPNNGLQRLGRLFIDGPLREGSPRAKARQLLTFTGTPNTAQCLLTVDCPLGLSCVEGVCSAQTSSGCTFDSQCSFGGRCRAGTCSSF
jgi:hypothetical protein